MKNKLMMIWSLALAIIVISSVNNSLSRRKNEELNNQLKAQYQFKEETAAAETMEAVVAVVLPGYAALQEINEDIVGWIKIPGTVIDYPVVRAEDNDFYLHHNFMKEPDKAGSIFMDFRNAGDAEEPHTIVYGHHMKDGSMFMALMGFKEPEFLLENRIIEFNTLYENIQWEIFSAYVTSTDFDYLVTHFPTKAEYRSFIQIIKSKGYLQLDSEITAEDRILTLSTCTYEFKNARLVIHARRLYE